MFRCPTSELPICPSGSPTAKPLALPLTNGYSFISLSMTGVFASATAFPFVVLFRPYPSKIINTVGFLLILNSSFLITFRLILKQIYTFFNYFDKFVTYPSSSMETSFESPRIKSKTSVLWLPSVRSLVLVPDWTHGKNRKRILPSFCIRTCATPVSKVLLLNQKFPRL